MSHEQRTKFLSRGSILLFIIGLLSVNLPVNAAENNFNDKFFSDEGTWSDDTKKISEPAIKKEVSPTEEQRPLKNQPEKAQEIVIDKKAKTEESNIITPLKKEPSQPQNPSNPVIHVAPVELKLPSISEEEKAISPGEALSSIITEETKLNPLYSPRKSSTRKIYDYRTKIPNKFFRTTPPGKENLHLPKISYQKEYSSLLFTAAAQHNVGAVSALLEKGADINAATIDEGATPLMKAVGLGDKQMTAYLILRGADLNKQDHSGRACVHIAASQNDLTILNLLIKSGAKWNIADKAGKKLFDYISSDAREKLWLIIAETFQNKDQGLLEVVSEGSLEAVRYLISQGVSLETKDQNGETPLIIATKNNKEQIVNLLLSSGARIETKDLSGNDSLMIAKENGNKAIINILDTVFIKKELESGKVTTLKAASLPLSQVQDALAKSGGQEVEQSQQTVPTPRLAENYKIELAAPEAQSNFEANTKPGFFQILKEKFSFSNPVLLEAEPTIAEEQLSAPAAESADALIPSEEAKSLLPASTASEGAEVPLEPSTLSNGEVKNPKLDSNVISKPMLIIPDGFSG